VLDMIALFPERSSHLEWLSTEANRPSSTGVGGVNTAIVVLLEKLPLLCLKRLKKWPPSNDVLTLEEFRDFWAIWSGEFELVLPFYGGAEADFPTELEERVVLRRIGQFKNLFCPNSIRRWSSAEQDMFGILRLTAKGTGHHLASSIQAKWLLRHSCQMHAW
jgi:hypothetical protein